MGGTGRAGERGWRRTCVCTGILGRLHIAIAIATVQTVQNCAEQLGAVRGVPRASSPQPSPPWALCPPARPPPPIKQQQQTSSKRLLRIAKVPDGAYEPSC